MMRKTYLYVEALSQESVFVNLADFTKLLALPRELFDPEFVSKLAPGDRIIGRVNSTRSEQRLIIAGPFELGVKKTALPDYVPENRPILWCCRGCGESRMVTIGAEPPHHCKGK